MEFNAWIGVVVRRLSWAVGEVQSMIVMRLVGSPVEVAPSVGWIIFFGGLILLVGILYYFAKHTK
jgi:hypothetical protein